MKVEMESGSNLIEYYEDARQSFVVKMKSEEDERSNLKFKIAAYVIHEISYSTPSWFKNHFLSYIAKNDKNTVMMDKDVIKVEKAFYDVVADYLIKMESEIEYVKKIFAPFTEDQDKKDFWEPIVFDAFLIVGIYFTPSLESGKERHDRNKGRQIERNVNPRYLNYNNSDYDRNASSHLTHASSVCT